MVLLEVASGMDLIILESPNKVRDVQRYAEALGFQARVTATLGHLVDLPPMSGGVGIDTVRFAPERVVPCKEGAAERIARLRAEIARADRVIVATDPDREGEAIEGRCPGSARSCSAWLRVRGGSRPTAVAACRALDAPLGRRSLLRSGGACYPALRCLPGRDSHPLEKSSGRKACPQTAGLCPSLHGAPRAHLSLEVRAVGHHHPTSIRPTSDHSTSCPVRRYSSASLSVTTRRKINSNS
jgi:Toprim domain-containing protein